jgi:hypothetical protein
MKELFREQVTNLSQPHFLVLYWCAQAEDRRLVYNITNCFDDMKRLGITRTKQTAVAVIDAMRALRFVSVRDEGNRKNLYITPYGAKALEMLVLQQAFTLQKSAFLEEK